MRLGQLARKLEVRPADIVDFLAAKSISIDNGTNTRMQADHIALAIQHFSPGSSFEDTNEDALDDKDEGSDDSSASDVASPPENTVNEAPAEKGEVIKAPKIELSGLKVLGKIDLPETRKKEPEPETGTESTERQKEFRKGRQSKEFKRSPLKNPIAQQREQEALEARKKREEERRLQKERRTQNYLNKVKTPQPTKAARIFNEETQQMTASDLQEQPKTLWGKFVKWLTT